jgi:hypothetical protein
MNNPALVKNFEACVQGYHMLNTDPIKEGVWESINALILQKSGFNITHQSNGSHSPGADISCETFGNISNKSAKYEISKNSKHSFSISSYRLSKVCNTGNIEEIIAEINKRKNFNYYSILVRKNITTPTLTSTPTPTQTPPTEPTEAKPTSTSTQTSTPTADNIKIHYDWYMIPSEHPAFNPNLYTWLPKVSQKKQVGWETNQNPDGSMMKIQFSMSSQLWINAPNMSEYLVASADAPTINSLNYIDLYNKT